jgi:hypothetical protein
MNKGTRTLESWMLVNGKDGDVFYTHKKDKDITALGTYYNRRIYTERLILVDNCKDKPGVKPITKVTLLPIKKL